MTTPGPVMVAFDIDGVVLRGGTLLPGVPEAVDDVLRRGLALRFVTNNSTRHRSEVAAKLSGLGLPVEARSVMTSAAATASWLAERLPAGSRVMVVGGDGLVRELAEAGLDPIAARDVPRPSGGPPGSTRSLDPLPAGVVVGLDTRFDYSTLATAQQALLSGALFVATNADATFPVEGGVLPGGGAIVAALSVASGRRPTVIGKPEPGLAQALCAQAGAPAERIVFVGDRLDTDIEMAVRAGMRAVLVLTGVTKRADLDAPGALQPEFVLETLREFPLLLERLVHQPE